MLRAFANYRQSRVRRHPLYRVQFAPRKHARTRRSDADACAALAGEISDIPADVLAAAIESWRARRDFLNDRAYRLLVGVRDGGTVPAIDAARREQFAREEELGRLPLPEAFAQLAATRPELRDLENRARAGEVPRREVAAAVDAVTNHDERTVMRIVAAHVMDCTRNRDDSTPLFDRDPRRDLRGRMKASVYRGVLRPEDFHT
jgi:hypothetical protein